MAIELFGFRIGKADEDAKGLYRSRHSFRNRRMTARLKSHLAALTEHLLI
jgi:hypothetical protein